MRLLGYTDRLNVAPGDTIRFMVSSDHPSYEATLVRLIHGDVNPAGPGFKEREVPSPINGSYRGRHQAIRSGSYIEVPPRPDLTVSRAFTIAVFVKPTTPSGGPQAIVGHWSPDAPTGIRDAGSGWALLTGARGDLEFWLADGVGRVERHTTGAPLRDDWFFVAAAFDGATGQVALLQQPVRIWPDDPGAADITAASMLSGLGAVARPLLMAGMAVAGEARPSLHLNGRLDRPRLFSRALTRSELEHLAADPDDLSIYSADLAAAWDFAADFSSDRVRDISGRGHDGRTVNMPARAVTGHNFSGRETSFRLAPREYGAIHFHTDDLEDAGWEVAFELTVPADLPSGVYAARLRANGDEDHLPFIVRPPRGTTRSPIAVLASTVTYLTYSNFTDLGPWVWRGESQPRNWDLAKTPNADPLLFKEVFQYIDENALYGLYDLHVDGSGVVYGSQLKPNLTMRPKFRYRVWAAPPRFAADLYLVDWLEAKGIEVDFITDHDLHAEGVDLLRPYRVVVSSSHHEYWTAPMLDGLETYLNGGGRFMYLGGNSFFGIISFDPEKPHKIELRRWGTGWPFECPPAERYHSTTGEPGGTWRNRGRAPNRLVGVGTCAAGFDRGAPYKRLPDSFDPRVAFIFDGIGPDELIGDIPSLQVRHGAGGYEIDRVDYELGSPRHTLLLASTFGLSAAYESFPDEKLQFIAPRDGYAPSSPPRKGEIHPFVRADMAFLPYPNDGAVFSVGAICWRGCISYNNYDNNVSRLTENVLRAFAGPGPLPGG